ncbi:hypothetical protein ACEZDB_12330 [Streptacidiphilus sp. N1-3]|uniref:LPXTG-motif cell wall anchor domain-containing protein n=1 Tax=Streptacidiphilus alkalitolerans TaxID=3342712 RepID=A0ABV6X0Q0_9ACTN
MRAVPVAVLLGAVTLLPTASAAFAKPAPGDNGDVKVHAVTTSVNNQRDDPKVCKFYLDAFNFDTVQKVSWSISQQPPTGHQQVLSSTLTLVNGRGFTVTWGLPDGHYKLTWTFAGEKGSAKHKVFMVDCPVTQSVPPGSPPSISPSSPPGGGHGPGTPPGTGTSSGPGTGAGPVGAVNAGTGSTSGGTDTDEIATGALLVTAAVGAVVVLRHRRRSSGSSAN